MSTKYGHVHHLVQYPDITPSVTSHSDFTNVTEGGLFDTGGATVLAIQVKPKGSVIGTDPVLTVRIDHSCDGLNWNEHTTFADWNNEVDARMSVLTGFAQFIRVMIKVAGTNATWGGLEVKASLKG